MRGKRIVCLQLILALLTSIAMVNMVSAPTTTIEVTPPDPVQNPGDTFVLSIEIVDAPEISAWEFKIKYDIGILAFPIPDIVEGGFLSNGGMYPVNLFTKNWQMLSSVQIGCALSGPLDEGELPPSGSGTLVELTMEVTESGTCDLILYDVTLIDYDTGSPLPADVVNGYFHTTKPFVDFTWTPANPEKNEETTFDASACWDPDGGTIDNYIWDFGDGTPIVETTDPTTTHTFTAYRDAAYQVTLTVVDDEMDTWSKTKLVRLYHDMTVPDVWNDASDYLDKVSYVMRRDFGVSLVLITAVNTGTYTETFDVTLTVTHDETGKEGFILPFWSNPVMLTPGTGSGFGLMAYWLGPLEGFDMPAGYYTMTATVSPHPGEVEMGDTADNTRSISIRLIQGDLISARITNHAFSVSKHGEYLNFYGKIKNKQDLLEPLAHVNAMAVFEIENPYGETIVLETDTVELTNDQESDWLMVSLGPLTSMDAGAYFALGYAKYEVWDATGAGLTFGEMDYYGMACMSNKQKTLSFTIRP